MAIKEIYVLLHIGSIATICYANSNFVNSFDVGEVPAYISNQKNHRIQRRDAPGQDETCKLQESTFLNDLGTNSADKSHTFINETRYAMALAWAGKNDGVLIIVTTETDGFGKTISSTVYESNDFGATVRDVTTAKNVSKIIKKHNGLQRNPYNSKKVYLLGEGPWLYITENGGQNFNYLDLPFTIDGEIVFHSSEKFDGYLLAKNAVKNLYVSFDNGKTWKKIHENVETVYWGVLPEPGDTSKDGDNEMTIYLTATSHNDNPIVKHFFDVDPFTLEKSTDGGNTWTNLRTDVLSFERREKFLYASILKVKGQVSSIRLLQFSVDGGKTWREPKLPTTTPDQFYKVMDIDDGVVFLHVDDEGDTGHGILYTSAGEGIIYSESLPNHLYPNYGTTHDFYRIASMRGVYITSQMGSDNSIHSMITYNRGAEWQKIPRPPAVPCKDESKECYLQVHGLFSLSRNIKALPPISEKTALGLILVHAHVAESLQTTDPDVFVSSDGGYSWNLALKGPHFYQIGDHGGMLVAVSRSEPHPKVVKFSLDEGRCWHEYTFTNKTLNITGVLTEPEGKSAVFMIWGYVTDTRKWEVHIIDFKDIIKKQCGDTDYEPWLEHAVYGSDKKSEAMGCLLGQKRTLMRLKKDSWCYNGYNHVRHIDTQVCQCTNDDYECDYGYFRPRGSGHCVKIPEFKGAYVELCLRGHEEEEISEGYRKIPGDKCRGGFVPSSKKMVLGQTCDDTSKTDVQFDKHEELTTTLIPPSRKPFSSQNGTVKQKDTNPFTSYHDDSDDEKENAHGISKAAKVLALTIVGAVLVLAAVLGVYFIQKLLRIHKVEYRYSLLNQGEDDPNTEGNDDLDHNLDSALTPSSVTYQDSDEGVLTAKVLLPSRRPVSSQNGTVKQKDTNPFTSYHDDSDDGLDPSSLL